MAPLIVRCLFRWCRCRCCCCCSELGVSPGDLFLFLSGVVAVAGVAAGVVSVVVAVVFFKMDFRRMVVSEGLGDDEDDDDEEDAVLDEDG